MTEVNLRNIFIPKTKEYTTGSSYEPITFYFDGLANSVTFDLLLGYFSSSAINLLSIGFTRFLLNGGKMRLVINQFLRKEDKEILEKGISEEPLAFYKNEPTIHELKTDLEDTGEHFFNCIAWLIANKRIELQIVKPKSKTGIAHYKSGIFSDGVNDIQFKGSCNFTANALMQNLEEIDVKTSWDEHDKLAIDDYKKRYEEIFSKKAEYIDYLGVEDIEEVIVDNFGIKTLEELIEDEIKLITNKKALATGNKRIKKHLEELEKKLTELKNRPKFPFPEGPRPYQAEAYENWVKNGKKGIFAMATGTGKTITALNCLLNEFNEVGYYQAVILVPTTDLQMQWIEELKNFNFHSIYAVSLDVNWKKKLSKLTTALQYGMQKSFVVVATYASFIKNALQNFINYLPEQTVFIADEAHNIAAAEIRKTLPNTHFSKKIGLSATPKRIYDVEGTKEMNDFFHDYPPYIYEYTMEEAIAKGVLCQYDYYPHIVTLTELEMEQYRELTLKLVRLFDAKTKTFSDAKIANMLLIKRKRIIHKAKNKLNVFRGIIKEEYKKRDGLKYTFIYVPEGFDNEHSDERLLMYYNQAVMDLSADIRIAGFTGELKDRKQILQDFESGNIDVLSAMKVLDEGVDVPRAELAIFCSSTGNPRQFIQRRGRILRKHDDKAFATIHDLVVVPNYKTVETNTTTFKMEKTIIENELKRVADFAFLARNQYHAIESVSELCKYYNLDLFEIKENLD